MSGMVLVTRGGGCGGVGNGKSSSDGSEDEQNQLSLVALLLTALRKSVMSCRVDRQDQEAISAVHHMDIGLPTDIQHITHVTFDRFHGFLGLPVEFQVEIPCRVPSASTSVFGVSAESMQCSYDSSGNSVPTIILLMQERLYAQGGLKAEGIFRINPENSQEELVRSQLNRGIVPEDIDVHCLAGLIKLWFRELPSGVLDGLSPEQVLQCSTEEESVELMKKLKPTEAALLNWAVNLMADVVEQEESNKMNARNIAMVFAPNMTQMSDPLTALMHAVQVMNLLKTLIMKTRREREENTKEALSLSPLSSHSSERQIDGEYEESDISCESRGPISDDEENDHYSSNCSEDEYEVGSFSEIENCLLKQMNANENAKNGFREGLAGMLHREQENMTHKSCSTFNGDSGVTLSDSKFESSWLSTSDEEDSDTSSINLGHKEQHENPLEINKNTCDVAAAVQLKDSIVDLPLCINSVAL